MAIIWEPKFSHNGVLDVTPTRLSINRRLDDSIASPCTIPQFSSLASGPYSFLTSPHSLACLTPHVALHDVARHLLFFFGGTYTHYCDLSPSTNSEALRLTCSPVFWPWAARFPHCFLVPKSCFSDLFGVLDAGIRSGTGWDWLVDGIEELYSSELADHGPWIIAASDTLFPALTLRNFPPWEGWALEPESVLVGMA
jgi:hypothetical protein